MSSDETSKPQYFSNGDFEKVAADIISSPRRSKPINEFLDETLFQISPKQQEYYTKCFRHLLKTTQGTQDLSGAICGGDPRVVAFFKRSALDVAALSKIWSLSDVNEDGWLDLAEFSTAMHLVVLRIKGEVTIPETLPLAARPPVTPSRAVSTQLNASQSSQCSGTASISSTKMKPSPSWNPDSSTIDAFVSPPVIKQFSDTPPLLVDSCPTAIKHSALLTLKSPSGPPPAPPPRPQQRGHGRSASLDLKLIALNNGRVTNQMAGIATSGDGSTTATNEDVFTLASPPLRASQPPPTTNTFPPVPEQAVVPPPIPQRGSPPGSSRRSVSVAEAETQTEGKFYAEEDLRKFIDGFSAQLEDLLGEDVDSTDNSENGVDRWSKRCLTLRQQNAEMEAERARLTQVRLQLELRLQEFEEKAKSSQVNL